MGSNWDGWLVLWSSVAIWFSFYLLAVVLGFRLFQIQQRFRFHFFLFVGFVGAAWVFGFIFSEPLLETLSSFSFGGVGRVLHGLGVYFFLVMGFVIFYGLIDRSVSLKINSQFEQRGNAPRTLKQIISDYNSGQTDQRRILMLEGGGYARVEGDRVKLLLKGERFARGIGFCKQIFTVGRGG